jgi:hypothetical protein
MTSQGAGQPIHADSKIDAAIACLLHGNVRITAKSPTNEVLSHFNNDDAAIYKYVSFKKGLTKVKISVKPKNGGSLVLYADKPWHHRIAELHIEASTANTWKTITAKINNIDGIHALWLKAYGKQDDLFEIDWLVFE